MEQLFLTLSPLIGSALVLIFLRLWTSELRDAVKKVASRMDCFEQSQHACQLENAKVFTTKLEHQALDTKVDEIDTRVTRLESRQ